jgi:FkbM family methyltransferase
MTSSITLRLHDDVQIVVPNSLDLITPYVLQEQEDWFEDEIKFLRRLLQPGQKIIDIGANYGVYTLSMAKTVGDTGSIWSFEPASSTASFLAAGIKANDFQHIVLEQSALSSACGEAKLSLNTNSELNSLVHGDPLSESLEATETVPLVTLDVCMDHYDWKEIEFVKIDAEGEEANILQGGQRFFSELSPLVQYEIKVDINVHLELVQSFADMGYKSYRLVPGLNLLVPFDPESIDGYLLNLFCCKPDRAQKLSERGYLLDTDHYSSQPNQELISQISDQIKTNDKYSWQQTIAKLPYGLELSDLWEQTMSGDDNTDLKQLLAYYSFSCDTQVSNSERFTALQASLSGMLILCNQITSYSLLASLARIATDFGARSIAVQALRVIVNNIFNGAEIDISNPFFITGNQFDDICPNFDGNWYFAAALEELERLESFSSFYTGKTALPRLELLRDLGFSSTEMGRRLSLLQQRYNLN